MHEFHAWVGLGESTLEDDRGRLQRGIEELRDAIAEKEWHDARFRVESLNGRYFLTATGYVNRRREEADRLEILLQLILRLLPASWGLVYERDDETHEQPGPNAFKVRTVARGTIEERIDPFLSPCAPVIED